MRRMELLQGLRLMKLEEVYGCTYCGALAVVATWYLTKTLVACYIFGAPRVGDAGLLGWFKMPIYRIVNAAGPVPFVPPSGAFLG